MALEPRDDFMTEEQIASQLKGLQEDLESAARDLKNLGFSIRAHAGMDELNIEMEAIRSCLNDLQPALEECFTAIRCQVARGTVPKRR
jgi:hypothetical protein